MPLTLYTPVSCLARVWTALMLYCWRLKPTVCSPWLPPIQITRPLRCACALPSPMPAAGRAGCAGTAGCAGGEGLRRRHSDTADSHGTKRRRDPRHRQPRTDAAAPPARHARLHSADRRSRTSSPNAPVSTSSPISGAAILPRAAKPHRWYRLSMRRRLARRERRAPS